MAAGTLPAPGKVVNGEEIGPREKGEEMSETTTKERRWTVADIAAANERAGGHYFDRATLRFFGQTRGSFRVYQGGGRVFVFSTAHRRWDYPGLSSFAEFNAETGRIDGVEHPDGSFKNWKRSEVKAFVAELRRGGR
jgi:hypothetical protein